MPEHPFWPAREYTTWWDEIDNQRSFRIKYLDREGNPMVQPFATTGLGDDAIREYARRKAAELVGAGATFPEEAPWV